MCLTIVLRVTILIFEFELQGWIKLFNGWCDGPENGYLSDRTTDSVSHCQSLCTGSCKYVSYATTGPKKGDCWGGPNCSNGGDTINKWVSYEKKGKSERQSTV